MADYNVRIYQINPDRDAEHRSFFSLSHAYLDQTSDFVVDSSIYDHVFKTQISDWQNDENALLDELYVRFNGVVDWPEEFRGHALSVSDVIVLEDNDGIRAYYCQPIGWARVTFDEAMAQDIFGE